jgi:hypothetical protein
MDSASILSIGIAIQFGLVALQRGALEIGKKRSQIVRLAP